MSVQFLRGSAIAMALLLCPWVAAGDPPTDSSSLDEILGPSTQNPAPATGTKASSSQTNSAQASQQASQPVQESPPPSGGSAAEPSSTGTPSAGSTSPETAQAPSNQTPSPTQGAAPSISVPASAKNNTAATPQNATAAAAPQKVQNRVLEEIVVTAEKREESIQNVPIAIQAFSGNALAARDIQTVQQLDTTIPSLHFTQNAGYLLISLRGIGTDEFVPSADPSIVTYIDGIYLPQGQATMQSLGNVARVEVLKGPQGTLFGRDALAGAINVITEVPGNEYKASAELAYSRFNDRLAKLSISGPIISWLSAGLAGSYELVDPYYNSLYFTIPPAKTRAGRVKLDFHPSDSFSVDLTAFHSDQQNANLSYGKNTDPYLLGRLVGIRPTPDDFTLNADHQPASFTRQDLYYGNAAWKLPWFDVKMLGGIEQLQLDKYIFDYDQSPQPLVIYDAPDEFIRVQTGELQLVSNEGSFQADRFKWVVGLYYYHSLGGFGLVYLRVLPDAVQALTQNDLGITLPPTITNLFSMLPYDPLTNGVSLAISGLIGTYSYSGYTQGTYSLLDWLDLTLGGRYQYERRFLTTAHTDVINPITGNPITLFDFKKPSATAFNFSPKAVLTARPSDNSMVYLSYGVAYKSGTYNVVNIYTPPKYIVPEKVATWELGTKLGFFDDQIRLNAAVFANHIVNLQTGFVSLLSGGAVQFITAPGARSRGIEFDATVLPLPTLDPGLVLTANAAYVSAKYTNFPNGVGFRPGTGLYEQNVDLSGNTITNSPRLSGGLGAVQTIPFQNGTVELGVDAYYNSGFYYDALNTVREHAYTTLAARASYEFTPWHLRVTVFGNNLLNTRYHVQQFPVDFGVIKTLAQPISMGVRLNWNY